jgi:hypothetical protein
MLTSTKKIYPTKYLSNKKNLSIGHKINKIFWNIFFGIQGIKLCPNSRDALGNKSVRCQIWDFVEFLFYFGNLFYFIFVHPILGNGAST